MNDPQFQNYKRVFFRVFLIALVIIIPLSLKGAVMSSSDYQITTDSLNIGGGNSVSSSYINEGTVGEVATGDSASTNYEVKAGYEQMTSNMISITSPADIALANINGLTGGVSTSSASWTVTTDDPAGYSLSIQAATSPALQGSGGASFADYSPGGTPSFAFTISPSASAFGFTPQGSDIAAPYRDNGSTCGVGSSDTQFACWDGFSTTTKVIAQRSSADTPSGVQTTVVVEADSGSSHIQESGSYTATLTVTAVAL